MKKIWITALIALSIACSENPDKQQESASAEASKASYTYYGEEFNTGNALAATQLVEKMGDEESRDVKVEGTIKDVCQAKGCWMTVDLGDGETMRVTFKDYGFFVPKDAGGKKVIVDGVASKTMVDVETQRHYAADAGKSEEEIKQITEPSPELTFVAEGVAFKDENNREGM